MKAILRFGNEDSRKTFKSKEDLVEFLTNEQLYWRDFFTSQNQNPIATIKNNLHTQYGEALRLANQITDESTFETKVEQIAKRYQDKQLLHVDGKRAKHAFSLSEVDEKLQYYMVGYFLNSLYNQSNDPMAFRAIFEGLKYEDGISSNIESEKASLESLKDEWDEKLSTLETGFNSTNDDVIDVKSKIDQYFIPDYAIAKN